MKSQDINIIILESNIDNDKKVAQVCTELLKFKGVYNVSIDLEDWEKVLRVVCHAHIQTQDIEEKIAQLGFHCSELSELPWPENP